MEEVSDVAVTEAQEVNTGFSAHDRQLTVPEEVIVYLNQLNAANMIVESRIESHSKEPIMRFVNGKYCILDAATEKTIMSADWHLIGEFRIVGFGEDKIPNDIEFVWGWCVRPEDPHTTEVFNITEALPYGMQPLTFPLVKFEDIGILEILKAYSFNILNLDYITQKFSTQLQSYGIFGLYNIEWMNVGTVLSPEWEHILGVVREMVATRMQADETLVRKTVVSEVWQTPEVLSLVADYRRKKDELYTSKQEFVNKFKNAISNPNSLTELINTPTVEGEAFVVNEQVPLSSELDLARASVQKAFTAVEEVELAKLESIGDDM